MRIDYGEILFVGPCNFKCFHIQRRKPKKL